MAKRLNERGLERRREHIVAHPGKRTEVLIDTGQETLSDRRYASYKQRVFVLRRDGYRCRYCKSPVTMVTAVLDHSHPFKAGGKTVVGNLVACCPDCNKAKGNSVLAHQP